MKPTEIRGHVPQKCPEAGCENPGHCNWCDGGLFSCTRCNGAEGSLPWECPGVFMTEDQADEVYASRLDFIGGEWVKLDKPSARAKATRIHRQQTIEQVEKEGRWTPGAIAAIEAGEQDTWSPKHSTWSQLAKQYSVRMEWLACWETCTRCKGHIDPEELMCDPGTQKTARVIGQKGGRTLWNHYSCFLELDIELLRSRVAEQDQTLSLVDQTIERLQDQVAAHLQARIEAQRERDEVTTELQRLRPELVRLSGLLDVTTQGHELNLLKGLLDETRAALEPKDPGSILLENIPRAVAARQHMLERFMQAFIMVYESLMEKQWEKPDSLQALVDSMLERITSKRVNTPKPKALHGVFETSNGLTEVIVCRPLGDIRHIFVLNEHGHPLLSTQLRVDGSFISPLTGRYAEELVEGIARLMETK